MAATIAFQGVSALATLGFAHQAKKNWANNEKKWVAAYVALSALSLTATLIASQKSTLEISAGARRAANYVWTNATNTTNYVGVTLESNYDRVANWAANMFKKPSVDA